MTKLQNLLKGLIKENPVLVLVLGTCPTLAISTSVTAAFGMGIAATVVLILSNMAISALRKVIPDTVRIPCYITVIAGFVTIVELVMEAYTYELYQSLGVYLALIVVNCIILGRAEMYANKHGVVDSAIDGLGMGLGFTVSLSIIGFIRELLGAGTVFGVQVMPAAYKPIAIFIKAPGAFLVLAFLVIIMNALKIKNRADAMVQGCDGCCATCAHAKEEGKEAQK